LRLTMNFLGWKQEC